MLRIKYFLIAVVFFGLGSIAHFYFSGHRGALYDFVEGRDYALPLNNPMAVSAQDAVHMHDDDLVFGVSMAGRYRAYPRWIMVAYHVTNDTIDNKPLMLVQCEICSSVAAFIPTVKEGDLVFAPCGLKGGTFEICDYNSLSRWTTFNGQSYKGILKGRALKRVPMVVQTWKNWKTLFPETDVIYGSASLKERSHGRSDAAEIGAELVPMGLRITADMSDKRLKQNELVFGIQKYPISIAFPLALLTEPRKPFVYSFAGQSYLLIRFDQFAVSAFEISDTDQKFSINKEQSDIIVDNKGGRWNFFGKPLPDSKNKDPLTNADGYFAEWYEWINSHPNSEIARQEQFLKVE